MTSWEEKKQTIGTYNKTARTHAEKFNKMGARAEDVEKAFSFIKKENPKVIELGCGNGRDAKEIIKHTDNYLGIDLSKELLFLAKKYAPEAKFKLADFETFRFPNNIDIIFSFASILHSDKSNLEKVFKRIFKKLSKKGIVFISTKYGRYSKKTIDKEGHGAKTYYFYNLITLKKIMPKKTNLIHKKIYTFQNQKWIDIIFQKS